MIRFSLLQFRGQAVTALAALLAAALVLIVTRAHLDYLFAASGLAACHSAASCPALAGQLAEKVRGYSPFQLLYWGGLYLLYVVPALVGTFWGAPLIAREIETGTFRVAWTQSVSRTRWLVVKLTLGGLAAMAAAGLLSLMVAWWASRVDPLDPFGMNRLQPAMFGARGIVPIGYTAFAFALGVTAGMLIRNTVPAMAVTLGAFAAVEGAVIAWIRPHLIAPVHAVLPLNLATVQAVGNNVGAPASNRLFVSAPVAEPSGWVYSSQVLSAAGHTSLGPEPQICASGDPWQSCLTALGKLHLHQAVTYQSASRYWPLQWAETSLFLALALLLAGCCFVWTRRRLTP
jgi:hypothetical protein